jgi:hypothetical protein
LRSVFHSPHLQWQEWAVADVDHPVFLVTRADIPQPGAYAHFHWLGDMPAVGETKDGCLLHLTAVERFCFIHHGAESATSGATCRANGGVNVDPGTDIATHLNIVTSAGSKRRSRRMMEAEGHGP